MVLRALPCCPLDGAVRGDGDLDDRRDLGLLGGVQRVVQQLLDYDQWPVVDGGKVGTKITIEWPNNEQLPHREPRRPSPDRIPRRPRARSGSAARAGCRIPSG